MVIVRMGALCLFMASVWAGAPEVTDVRVSVDGANSYRFDVTVRHEDEGWEHYADRFEILTADGEVLGIRVLYHPHVEEQPFTRSLSGVKIGDDLPEVRVRAHDSVHGYGEKEQSVTLPP